MNIEDVADFVQEKMPVSREDLIGGAIGIGAKVIAKATQETMPTFKVEINKGVSEEEREEIKEEVKEEVREEVINEIREEKKDSGMCIY